MSGKNCAYSTTSNSHAPSFPLSRLLARLDLCGGDLCGVGPGADGAPLLHA